MSRKRISEKHIQDGGLKRSLVGDRMRTSLLNAIRTRALRAGDMLPSQGDLAQQFNIGEITVRRTLFQMEEEGIITRERGRGTFITKKADMMFEGRAVTKTVLLAVRTRGHLFSDLLQRMILSMQKDGYIPAICGLDDNDGDPQPVENLAHVLAEATNNSYGAAILEWPDWGDKAARGPVIDAARSLTRQGIPVLWLLADSDQVPLDIKADVLTVDYASGMKLATQLMIDHGHKHIAFLTNYRPQETRISNSSSAPFFQGYKQAMRFAGLQQYSQVIIRPHGKDAEEFARQILSGQDRPTAIVTCQDYRLVCFVKIARECGISIPDDLELIGYNNTPWAETYELSSVDIRLDLLSEHAANWLNGISTNEVGATVSMIKPDIVLRKSTKNEMAIK